MCRDPHFRHASFSAESSEGKVGNKVCKKTNNLMNFLP